MASSLICGTRRALLGRAKAFTPASLSGLALWLDPSYGLYQETTGASATTPAAAHGDPVGTWKARTGQYFTASATTKRPLLQISGAYRYLLFDGVDDFLTSAASPFAGGAAASASVFARFRYATVPASGKAAVFGQVNDQIEFFSDGDAGHLVGRSRDNASNYHAANLAQAAQGVWYSGGTVNDGAGSLVTGYRDAATATAATGGGLLVSTANFQVGAMSGGALGWLAGSVASVVGYGRALTATEVAKLFTFLGGLAA
jgi:hypothetical protein